MSPDESLARFKQHLTRFQVSGALTPAQAVAAMLSFFREVPADTSAQPDGDMLLFQWGTYDWANGPESFEVGIVRQFMGPSAEDDEITQLSVTFSFNVDAQLRSLGNDNRWCHDTNEFEEFQRFVLSSAAYRAVSGRTEGTARVEYDRV